MKLSEADKQKFLAKYADAVPVDGPLDSKCLKSTPVIEEVL
jgi:hypothetical protein